MAQNVGKGIEVGEKVSHILTTNTFFWIIHRWFLGEVFSVYNVRLNKIG